MSQYQTPGVFFEEVAGARPIEGVGTATGAFVGIAERGVIGQAVSITSWTQFVETFGGPIANGYLAYAVNQFFAEGGTRCYVVRVCHYAQIGDPTTKTARVAERVLRDRAAAPQDTLRVSALSEGSWGDRIGVLISDAQAPAVDAFDLIVLDQGRQVERHPNLRILDAAAKVNAASKYVRLTELGSSSAPPGNRPAASGAPFDDLLVTALQKELALEVATEDAAAGKFSLTVRQAASVVDGPYAGLTLGDAERRINGVSTYIQVAVLQDPSRAPMPPTETASPAPLLFYSLAGGWDGLAGITLKDRAATPANTLGVSAWREGVKLEIKGATTDPTNRFKLVVRAGEILEEFDNLTLANVEQEVNERSQLIEVDDLASPTAPPDNRPAPTTAAVDVASGLSDADFVGDEAARNGLHAFDIVDDINIVAIPDRPGDREVVLAASAYCQNRRDCFFVADPPFGIGPQDVRMFKEGTGAVYAGNALSSSYAALYYPWVYVDDPLTGGKKAVPPSGAVVGTYSATDVTRGVHKAPAGTVDGALASAVDVERPLTNGDQEILNPAGVNAIRSFPGFGIVLWGARTLSPDAAWKYVNVRRLLLFLEESIEKATRWVVFEPNDRSLWARVKRDVTSFLSTQWQAGALFGATAQEAFFVKIDDENNPPEVRDVGRLVIDVGVAPVKPAEFVIFRISQKTQGVKG